MVGVSPLLAIIALPAPMTGCRPPDSASPITHKKHVLVGQHVMFGEAGVDLSTYPSVGVGSVCRRQHTGEIREVLEALRDRDPEVPLHGYGVKTQGLRIYGDLLASSDSMGWSLNARKNPRLPGCTHGKCWNCLKWALRWRRCLVAGDGCEEHGEACDGGGWCWQRQLWEMKQARNAAAAAAGLARRNAPVRYHHHPARQTCVTLRRRRFGRRLWFPASSRRRGNLPALVVAQSRG